MTATPEQVAAAVRALYSASPDQQTQANHFLTSFQHTHDAWQVAFALLAAEQPQEVQFFAATLLVRKVRSDWTKLDAGSRQGLGQAIRSKFQEVLSWQHSGPLVLRQQCALLAAVAGASGGEGANELITQALGLLPSNPALALELLTALAQEAEDLDRVRRLALVNVLMPRARELLGTLGSLLGTAAQQLRQGQPGSEQLAAAVLRCAEAWLQLNPVAGSGCIFTPAELNQQQPQLFTAVLSLVTAGGAGGSEQVIEAAVQVLLLIFGPENFSSDESADLAASAALAQALLTNRGQLAGATSDTLPAGVAKLASALAERCADFCCGQMPEAVALSGLVLECLSRPGTDMAEHTLDYFLMANTVSLGERPPELRAPLYEAVLQAVVPHASYPPSFTTWQEEYELDEDAFKRLREQGLSELLDVAYGLLRMRYLTHAWQLLQGAASWQAAEAALYLLSAVSLSVKARVLSDTAAGSGGGDENSSGGGGGGAAPSTAVQQDRQQTQQLLSALFARVCSPEGSGSMLGAHPALAEATCRLLEHYSSWFGRATGEPALLQAAFQLLLRALHTQQASHLAARAFQQLCLRCSWKLKDTASFGWLLEAAHGSLQQAGSGLAIEDRQLVVEGLARVAAGLRGQQLLDAAAHLTSPFLQQAQQAVAAAGSNGAAAVAPDAGARRCLADSLRLLASALRHLAPAGDDSGELGSQPAAAVLAQAGPTLRQVAQSPAWQADREAVAAVVEVYQRAVGTAKNHGLQLVMAALPVMSALFAATAVPSCLDVVSEALEMQYEQPGVQAAATSALAAACDAALPALQGDGLRENPSLVSALLRLAHQCAVFAPAHLWASSTLPLLVQLATAAVRLREADTVSQALEFIARLLVAYETLGDEGISQAHVDAVHAVLAGQGEALTGALLAAVCDTCPRHLMRSAADCMRRLLPHPVLGQQARGWLAATAASGQLPGVADGYLTAEDCSTFATLAPGLQGPRFNALVVDFGLIARGHNTSDCLLAYEF